MKDIKIYKMDMKKEYSIYTSIYKKPYDDSGMLINTYDNWKQHVITQVTANVGTKNLNNFKHWIIGSSRYRHFVLNFNGQTVVPLLIMYATLILSLMLASFNSTINMVNFISFVVVLFIVVMILIFYFYKSIQYKTNRDLFYEDYIAIVDELIELNGHTDDNK